MTDTRVASHLDYLDDQTWQRVVRVLVESEAAEIIDQRAEEILSGAGSGTRLFRIIGSADTGDRSPVAYSFVLKMLTHDRMSFQSLSRDQQAWDYWKREWHAYRSPWLQTLTGPLVAPRCLATGEEIVAETGEELAWIAMADLQDHESRPWPPGCFGEVAQHVGVFNGGSLNGSWASESWFSRGWIRGWTDLAEPLIEVLPTVGGHPDVSQIYPPDVIHNLIKVWDQREQLMRALDELPQTICHNDVFPRNVFVLPNGMGRSVAIDWAFCGRGAIGQELSALVAATIFFLESRPGNWEDLERNCLDGYTLGLRRAGWVGSSEEVLIGYLISTVLRFGVGGLPPVLGLTSSSEYQATVEHVFGCTYDNWVANTVAGVRFQDARISRVLALLGL